MTSSSLPLVPCYDGLETRSHSAGSYLRHFVEGARFQPEPTELGKPMPEWTQMNRVLSDEDTGFFIVDREGVVRYSIAGAYGIEGGARPIPSNEEIEHELARLTEETSPPANA